MCYLPNKAMKRAGASPAAYRNPLYGQEKYASSFRGSRITFLFRVGLFQFG
jgi:hypothetical protein